MFTIKKASFIVNTIYGKKNKSLDFEYMYSFLTRKTSYLTREFIRADGVDKSKIKETYIESLSWLIAISQYLDTDLESSFFSKFPGICPYCINSPCLCSQTHRKPEFTSNARKIKEELSHKKDSIYRYGSAQIYTPDMINNIYPSNKNIFNIFGGFYHSSRLFEELGELHEAYAKLKEDDFYSKTNLDDELADILAWMLSLWGIMFKDTDLGDAIDNYYIKGCPSCHSSECICDDYSGRIVSTLSRNEALEKIKALIMKEVDNTSDDEEVLVLKLKSSILSIEDAISSGSESDARRTVAELDSALAFIYQTIPASSPTSNQTELLSELDKSRKLI